MTIFGIYIRQSYSKILLNKLEFLSNFSMPILEKFEEKKFENFDINVWKSGNCDICDTFSDFLPPNGSPDGVAILKTWN